MGSELEGVRGQPLRQSAELKADPTLKDTDEFLEPHRRGELFVAAVMKGFIKAWSQHALSAGLQGQQRFPVRRVAQDGADIADLLVTMWIRARRLHAAGASGIWRCAQRRADRRLRSAAGRFALRTARLHARLLRSLRLRAGVEAARTEPACGRQPPPGLKYDRVRFDSLKTDKDEVFRFIWDNRGPLKLQDGAYTQVLSVQPSTRIGVDGFVVRETVAQYYQVARLTPDELRDVGIRLPRDYERALENAEARRRPPPPATAISPTITTRRSRPRQTRTHSKPRGRQSTAAGS